MLFVLTLIGALVISISNGLRNCDDCTEITQCRAAMNQVRLYKSEATDNMLRKAQCGYMKVCCFDFSLRSRLGESNEINDEDEIETHHNIILLPDECGIIDGQRIIGGKKAPMNKYPWLALISHKIKGKKVFNCGGTILNEHYVLTAAHCIYRQSIVGVRIGEYDISKKRDCAGSGIRLKCQENLQNIAVEEAIMHPNYTQFQFINDIGLLRLKKSINFSVANAGPICLPYLRSLREMEIADDRGVVAGWGKTENQTGSDVLLEVELPITDQRTCMSFYDWSNKTPKNPVKKIFCAGEEKRDACAGDSGGPFMLKAKHNEQRYRFIQFGIVSHGAGETCGTSTPGVYTDVRKYMKWILDTMEP